MKAFLSTVSSECSVHVNWQLQERPSPQLHTGTVNTHYKGRRLREERKTAGERMRDVKTKRSAEVKTEHEIGESVETCMHKKQIFSSDVSEIAAFPFLFIALSLSLPINHIFLDSFGCSHSCGNEEAEQLHCILHMAQCHMLPIIFMGATNGR